MANINHKFEELSKLEGINTDSQYMLSMVKWIDNEYYLDKILEYTGCKNYKLIHNENKESNTNIYLIYK